MGDYMELQEFNDKFGTEEQCRKYIYQLRFPRGHKCPRCQHNKSYITSEGTYKCAKCGYKMSVRNGTILEQSSLSLKQWVSAIWYASSVPHAGKVSIQAYQDYADIGSNRSAKKVKTAIDTVLKERKLYKLEGNVELCVKKLRTKGTPAYLVLVGEVSKRKVLRCRGKVYESYPTDVSAFVSECVKNRTKLNIPDDMAKIKVVVEKECKVQPHNCDYSAHTVDGAASQFVTAVQSCRAVEEAQRIVDELCAERNAKYSHVPFRELIKIVLSLPPNSSAK